MSFFFSCPCFFSDPFGKALEHHFQENKKIEQECEPELKPLPLHVTVVPCGTKWYYAKKSKKKFFYFFFLIEKEKSKTILIFVCENVGALLKSI